MLHSSALIQHCFPSLSGMLLAAVSTYQRLGWPDAIGLAALGASGIGLVYGFWGIWIPSGAAPANTQRRGIGIVSGIVLLLSLAMFFPGWETPADAKLGAGDALTYDGGVPPTRNERWLSDFANFQQDRNLHSGINATDFQVLILETAPFKTSTGKLTFNLTPIHDKLDLSAIYAFRATGLPTERLFGQLNVVKAGRGFEITGFKPEKGDSLICLIDVRRMPNTNASFPTTAQIKTAFSLTVK
jgi:hypothetical protein